MMNPRKEKRIVYYSKEDLASLHSLQEIDRLFKIIDLSKNFDINDLLELYNVKLYFDNNLSLPSWNDSIKKNYKTLIDECWPKIQSFWLIIDDENIISFIESVEYEYKTSFWELTNRFQTYKRIDGKIFSLVLNQFSYQINCILSFRGIVDYFNEEIKDFLIEYEKTAELLLSKFEESHLFNSPNYFFPSCLSLSDKEKIILRYIGSEHANLNYIRLIVRSKDSKDLRLSTRIRLNAKNKSKELNDEILAKGNASKFGVRISFDKNQNEPVKFLNQNQILEVSYSRKLLDMQSNDFELFHMFPNLFEYLDNTSLITLVSKESELDVLEKIFTKSKMSI